MNEGWLATPSVTTLLPHYGLGIRHPIETRNRKLEAGSCKLETGNQKPETRSRKPETGNQKWEGCAMGGLCKGRVVQGEGWAESESEPETTILAGAGHSHVTTPANWILESMLEPGTSTKVRPETRNRTI